MSESVAHFTFIAKMIIKIDGAKNVGDAEVAARKILEDCKPDWGIKELNFQYSRSTTGV
jgi:hypothetical protein